MESESISEEALAPFAWIKPQAIEENGKTKYLCPYCGSDKTHSYFDSCFPKTHKSLVGWYCLTCHKDFSIDGSPLYTPRTEAELVHARFSPAYNNQKCGQCGGRMYRAVNSYPPYCDSTFEEFECPVCGYSWASSI